MTDYVEIASEPIGILREKLMHQPDPIHAIAALPPNVPADDVCRLVREQYGLSGEFTPSVSERDQNFRLTVRDESRYVVKIANSAEEGIITDFQIQALLHIERQKCAVTVPRMIPTRNGSLITMMHWRMSARGEDDVYRQQSLQDKGSAERFLSLIDSMSREKFVDTIRHACGG